MNSVPESYKSNLVHLKHIIPLDFKTALDLPDSHTWTIPDQPTPDHLTHGAVPVIDLGSPQATTLIRQACEKWGVFQVTNHGIPIKLLNQIEFQTRRLFALPAHQKLLAARSPEGLTGYGQPRISTFFSKLMWTEGFTIMGSPLDHARQLWPHEYDRINFWYVRVPIYILYYLDGSSVFTLLKLMYCHLSCIVFNFKKSLDTKNLKEMRDK